MGQYVHVIYADGVDDLGLAMGGGSWTYGQVYEYDTWLDGCEPIIRYRIRKPRAMKLLQSIVENPPKHLIKEDA